MGHTAKLLLISKRVFHMELVMTAVQAQSLAPCFQHTPTRCLLERVGAGSAACPFIKGSLPLKFHLVIRTYQLLIGLAYLNVLNLI